MNWPVKMVGRELVCCARGAESSAGRTVLELKDVWVPGDKGPTALAGVSLDVKAGEIVGIAGVSGNGQRELAEAISGLRKVAKGQVLLNDKIDYQPAASSYDQARLGLHSRRPASCGDHPFLYGMGKPDPEGPPSAALLQEYILTISAHQGSLCLNGIQIRN